MRDGSDKHEEVSIFAIHVLYYNHIDIIYIYIVSRASLREQLACKMGFKSYLCEVVFFVLCDFNFSLTIREVE